MTRREAFIVEAPAQHILYREQRVPLAPVTDSVAAYQQQLYLAIAKYSVGEPLEDVRSAVAKAVAFLADDSAAAPMRLQDPEQYFAALWGLSLSMLFGDASPVFEQRLAGQDALIDHLLELTGSQLDLAPTLLYPKPYQALYDAIDAPAEAASNIDTFLKTWYAGMGRTHWHDTHLQNDPAFFGYWSFELAAVVKALSISDASFDENIFYPRDLVHQRMYRTWLDSDLGEADRKFKAAIAAQRDLEVAKRALSAFLSGETADTSGIDTLAHGMKMLATVLGLEQDALEQNPQLVQAGLMQLFQAALNISKTTLADLDDPNKVAQSPLVDTFKTMAQEAGVEGLDIDVASQLLSETEGFDPAALDPEARLAQARTRLETMNGTLEKLLQAQTTAAESNFQGLEKFAQAFMQSIGLQPQKPRDFEAETEEEVHKALSEANQKNMIGSDFDWNSIWKKD
jgi:hypothetical protein